MALGVVLRAFGERLPDAHHDPALDLAVCAAVVSSLNDVPIPGHVCLAAEVGLSGEIRAVTRLDQRLAEAEKLGFREMYVSQFNGKGLDLARSGMKTYAVGRLEEVLPGSAPAPFPVHAVYLPALQQNDPTNVWLDKDKQGG